MTDGGHFGFLPITAYAHTFDRDTPPILLLNFKKDKTNEKPIVALRDHGSAPYDQTVYTYQKSNEGEGST